MSAEQDEANRKMWRRAAEGWGRRQASLREATAPVSQWLVDAIDPQPGQRVLELAAGPGETGFLAAQRLGPEGRLISTDQSPEMVEVARRRAAELGLDNVDFDVLDAQEMELEPGSVDAILCRWGIMLMGDPDGALRRARAAIRPGGRIAVATWAAPDQNMWMAAPAMALIVRGAMPPPDPGNPSPFAMPEPDALAGRLEGAGFGDVRAETIAFTQSYPSLDAYWDITIDLAAPVAQALATLDAAGGAAVREQVAATLAPFIGPDGSLQASAKAVVASGVV
jgi:ubiquinone/menaquinone biosynthesis C-methylase UbiE